MSSPGTTTIGVFDSGFGGLTVLRALLPLVPSARYVYLGDTARLPYGSKSRETIARYAVSSARFLLDHGADLLVIACNTATALALDEIRAAALPIPVLGVIDPGAQAAALASRHPLHLAEGPPDPRYSPTAEHPEILVLATSATVQSHAYSHALAQRGVTAAEKACPLLVPLVEEGWIDHPVTREVARIYLSEAIAEHPAVNTLLLGCTHYPLLRTTLEETLSSLGHPLRIIDSAEATARAVAAHLGAGASPAHTEAPCTFFATDSVQKFQSLGSRFLGHPLPDVHLVDLGG
ncbi:MAG: glutamate racemase [Acidobacteriaceae bacterium]